MSSFIDCSVVYSRVSFGKKSWACRFGCVCRRVSSRAFFFGVSGLFAVSMKFTLLVNVRRFTVISMMSLSRSLLIGSFVSVFGDTWSK